MTFFRHFRIVARREGMSLLEILFATIILATALIPIASMIGFGFKGTMKDYRNLTALQLLESTMNQVLAADYDRIPPGSQTSTLALDATDACAILPLGLVASAGYAFTVSLGVTDVNMTFSYQPLNYEAVGYIASNPATWQFDPVQTISLNQASGLYARRVRRVVGVVEWNEPNAGILRSVRAVTFKVKMKQT